jgi:hypothetical protein
MIADHATLQAWLTRLHLTAIRDQLDNLLDRSSAFQNQQTTDEQR